MSEDNIYTINGGKAEDTATPEVESELPNDDYVIVDRDGDEFYGSGFMVFTGQHVAIMRDSPKGPFPVLLLPLDKVKVAQLKLDAYPPVEAAPF